MILLTAGVTMIADYFPYLLGALGIAAVILYVWQRCKILCLFDELEMLIRHGQTVPALRDLRNRCYLMDRQYVKFVGHLENHETLTYRLHAKLKRLQEIPRNPPSDGGCDLNAGLLSPVPSGDCVSV
jgi:hypothetical protein